MNEPAIRIDDLTVPRGGCLAVVGPNGIGKTRLVLQLAGRLRSEPGTLEVLGAPPGARAARPRTSLLTDGAGLGERTFAQGVHWVNALREDGQTEPAALAAAMGLAPELVDRPCEEGSRGEQRLMVLALSLCPPVEAALLDEPLSGLDEPHRRAVGEYVRRRRAEGLAVVCTSPYEAPGWPDTQVLYLPRTTADTHEGEPR